MTFEPGTDVLDARQVVQERLTQAAGIAGLPAVGTPPQMIQPLSSTGRVSMITLSSEELTPVELSVLARWVISPRLLGVPGVANVAIWGHRDRQLQVLVDPERLRREGVTTSQVIRTAGNALEVSPLSYLEASTPGTGGFIDTANQRLNIFHEQAITSAEELAQVPLEGENGERVTSGGVPVLLGDVTDVVEDHQPLIGDAACADGRECLLLVVEKFPGTNPVVVSEEVEDALEAMAPGLADMQIDPSVYEPGSYIESAFENLGLALLIGAVLLVLLIVVFYWEWRKAVMVSAAIAVSASAAVIVLNLFGTTVNLMVAAGLIVGLTVVIDDAVNDAHSMAAGFRERRESRNGPALVSLLVDSVAGTRRALFYATLMMAAATLPLFVLRR